MVENLPRKAEDRQARDLLLQKLEGPVSKMRLEEVCAELCDLITSSLGRRRFKVDLSGHEGGARPGWALASLLDVPLARWVAFIGGALREGTIEKTFRTSKGNLSLGSVPYRWKDCLNAYATVVCLAYLLWSWADHKIRVKYPERRLSEALRALESLS